MDGYIDRLMARGFNAVESYLIVKDFLREGMAGELNDFINGAEVGRGCSECQTGKSLTIILLGEEESETVPSER